MCKAPKVPPVKDPKKPQFLRNKYLDAFLGDSQAVNALRTGRSSLRVPLATETGGAQPAPPPAQGGSFQPRPIGVRRGGRSGRNNDSPQRR